MTTEKQPPANEDEAHFDDEGSAIGRPEPVGTEKTETGYEVPIPTRSEFFRNLRRASRSSKE